MNTLVIDIDDTILTTEKGEDGKFDYPNSKPYRRVIAAINYHYAIGDTIKLFTARGMKTFNGDVEKIEEFHRPILEKWLKDNKVKYHSLQFGKPWGPNVFYIDDKSLTINQFLATDPSQFNEHLNINKSLQDDTKI